jgi:hypothetical protein
MKIAKLVTVVVTVAQKRKTPLIAGRALFIGKT